MCHRKILGIIAAFAFLCLALSSILLRAQAPVLSDPDFADTLWIAKSRQIDKIATSDASAILQISSLKDVRAVAVDDQRGLLWAYIQNSLWAYRFNGQPLLQISLAAYGAPGHDKEVALHVNPENGTVWLGVKKFLYHFGPQGEWLSVHTLSEQVRALSWDPTTTCLWVATHKTVSTYDNTGNPCHAIDLGRHSAVQDIAVDPDSGDLWVAMDQTLRRYDTSGALLLEIDTRKLAYVVSDHQGGVWIATDKRLMRLDRSGVLLLDVDPIEGGDKIVALVHDPTDFSVWVASQDKVSHIRSDGHRLRQLDVKGEIQDLAFYADLVPPQINLILAIT